MRRNSLICFFLGFVEAWIRAGLKQWCIAYPWIKLKLRYLLTFVLCTHPLIISFCYPTRYTCYHNNVTYLLVSMAAGGQTQLQFEIKINIIFLFIYVNNISQSVWTAVCTRQLVEVMSIFSVIKRNFKSKNNTDAYTLEDRRISSCDVIVYMYLIEMLILATRTKRS